VEGQITAEDGSQVELDTNCMMNVESDQKSFLVFAATPAERTLWISEIDKTVSKMREKFQDETGKLAAVWKPDKSATACTCCGKLFSLIVRKHHCRNCGVVVCAGCSKERLLLSHIDEKYKVRVCDNCVIDCKNESKNFVGGVGAADASDGNKKAIGNNKGIDRRAMFAKSKMNSIQALNLDLKPESYRKIRPRSEPPKPLTYVKSDVNDRPPIWAKFKPVIQSTIGDCDGDGDDGVNKRPISVVPPDATDELAESLKKNLGSLNRSEIAVLGGPVAPPPASAPPKLDTIDSPIAPPPTSAPPLLDDLSPPIAPPPPAAPPIPATDPTLNVKPEKPSKPAKPSKPLKRRAPQQEQKIDPHDHDDRSSSNTKTGVSQINSNVNSGNADRQWQGESRPGSNSINSIINGQSASKPAVPPRPARFSKTAKSTTTNNTPALGSSPSPSSHFAETVNNNNQFTYEELKVAKDKLPPGVNPNNREQYLSDASFLTVFGCTKKTFDNYPGWKRVEKKKAAGLF